MPSPPADAAPARLTSAMLVSALIRRVQAAGGFAAVLRRGDAHAGAVLIECADRGRRRLVLERSTGFDGRDGWRTVAEPDGGDSAAQAERMDRRIKADPDLWIIELDIVDAERFAAETISGG